MTPDNMDDVKFNGGENGATVAEVMRGICNRLAPKYGAGEAKAMTRIIFENEKGWSQVDLAIKANEHLTKFMEGKIDGVVDRLLADEPIQYIFGVADFYGMKLKVTAATLIPRPGTAELVDLIVKDRGDEKDLRVVDFGTGSGCIAIALSRNLPFSSVTGVDISADALAVAGENARSLRADVAFVQADMLSLPSANMPAPLSGEFDVIVSNPPYIADSEKKSMERNVVDFEPAQALFVPDSDPLKFYNAVLDFAAVALKGNGTVYFEINPLYVAQLSALCRAKGFGNVSVERDSFGKQRFMKINR